MEAPLLRLDPILSNFARSQRLSLTKNDHHWPERSFRWADGSIERLIQLYLDDAARGTFTLWVCAHQDRQGRRYWKQKKLKTQLSTAELEPDLHTLLELALATVNGWSTRTLEYVTKVGGSKSAG